MKEEVLNWLKQAESDMRKAKLLFAGREYDGVTFYSQQAAEKALKSVHLYKDFGIIKTHDLFILGKKVGLAKDLIEKAILLNPFYTSSRYPLISEEQIISDEESAKDSLNHSTEILKWCKQQIKI